MDHNALMRLLARPLLLLLICLLTASPSLAQVPTNGLVASYAFNGNANDSVGTRHGAVFNASLTANRFGNGSSAYSFNGVSSFIEIPDADVFSVTTTGSLSISAWLRPSNFDFPKWEDSGYVYWLAKGSIPHRKHEWAFRMYNLNNTENRPNRISCYVFNEPGGFGVGSFVQDPITLNAWYHFVCVIDGNSKKISIWKNGVKRDEDSYINDPFAGTITPANTTMPVRVGTRDFSSYFRGAVDNIHVYNRVLTAAEIGGLYLDTTK